MTPTFPALALVAAIVLCQSLTALSLAPSAVQAPHSVLLKHGIMDMSAPGHHAAPVIQPESLSDAAVAAWVTPPCSARQRCQWLVHLISSTDPALGWPGALPDWLETRQAPVQVLSYLPHNTYHVLATEAAILRLHGQAELVLSTGLLHPLHKVAADVLSLASSGVAEDVRLQVRMTAFAFASRGQVLQALQSQLRQLDASAQQAVSIDALSSQDAMITIALTALPAPLSQQLLHWASRQLAADQSVLAVDIDRVKVFFNDDGAASFKVVSLRVAASISTACSATGSWWPSVTAGSTSTSASSSTWCLWWNAGT